MVLLGPTPYPGLQGSQHSTASLENFGFAMYSTAVGLPDALESLCVSAKRLLSANRPPILLSLSGAPPPNHAMEGR